MNETNRLLREYAEKGSENAFRELVGRYIDLVYSVAVRRTSGDAHRAEDIVQTVFTDLARKAADLPPNVQLGGWLHRHCCFVASTVHRSEARRQARERQAMDFLQSGGESTWNELAPVLDEAIQELQEQDREAIVMRFFEKRDLRSVGAALGTSEDAAQKRVSRALEKLRGILVERGMALTVAGLTGALASHAIAAAPADWAARIGANSLQQAGTQSAMAGAAAGGIGAALLAPAMLKLGGLIAAVALIVTAVVLKSGNGTGPADGKGKAAPIVESVADDPANNGTSASILNTAGAIAAEVAEDDTNTFRLTLVAKETGLPVSGRIEYRAWHGEKFSKRELVADEAGICLTSIPREGLRDLELTTRIDGFADTRLKWWPSRGQVVPRSYTLKLEKAALIGGRVVNPAGEPVSGARVGFNHDESPEEANLTESHLFSWIETQTDSEGRWGITRIADGMVRKIRGGARHPDYVGSDHLQVVENSRAQEELRAQTHLFTLKTGATVKGHVVDDSGIAVPGAEVLVGMFGESNSRKSTTGLDGGFEVKGCKPGKSMITANAPQYSPNSIAVEISLINAEPYQIVLSRGKILRLRVVDAAGQPVPGATVVLNTMDSMRRPNESPSLVQTEFLRKTDSDGRILWDQAPDRELRFDAWAEGFMRAMEVKVRPDGTEQVITLQPALRISGTVVDAKTGEPIPKFRVIAGWPGGLDGAGKVTPQWSPIERYWLTFTGGKFEYVWEEPVIYGAKKIEYIFKIDAQGYAPYVSRVVNVAEANVRFDVRLNETEVKLVTVLRANGEPAPGADIMLAGPMQYVELGANGFSRMDGVVRTTDGKGQFHFTPDESVTKVFAASADGFAESRPAALMRGGVIQLQAWGRVEGVITERGQPLAGKRILLDPLMMDQSQPRLRVGERVVTDVEGRFRFASVPAGKFRLAFLEEVPWEAGTSMHKPFENVEVRPGETSVVNYNEIGVEVTVRLQWPPGFEPQPGNKIIATIHTRAVLPPQEILNNPAAMREWRMRPEVQEFIAMARHFPLREVGGGVWKATDVQPGAYDLGVSIVDGERHGPPASQRVVVPEDAGERVDLGVVVLAPPGAGPTH